MLRTIRPLQKAQTVVRSLCACAHSHKNAKRQKRAGLLHDASHTVEIRGSAISRGAFRDSTRVNTRSSTGTLLADRMKFKKQTKIGIDWLDGCSEEDNSSIRHIQGGKSVWAFYQVVLQSMSLKPPPPRQSVPCSELLHLHPTTLTNHVFLMCPLLGAKSREDRGQAWIGCIEK